MNRQLLKEAIASKAILFTAVAWLWLTGCEKPQPPPPEPHPVTITQAITCTVPIYRDYVGHVVAKTSVQVMGQVSGILTRQYFVEGQEVNKGDLLLVIDPRPYQATLAKADATLAQTFANLRFTRERVARYSPLVKEDFVSKLNFDDYVTQVLSNEALILENRADIATAEINLGYCYIAAPMDCVTGKLSIKPGNWVDASANTVLTTLNQIQPILVDFFVPETDLLMLQERQNKGVLKLLVYPDPSHHSSYEGELTLIDNQVNTSTGAILFEGTLLNEDKRLWPGHFVDVRLILAEEQEALLLPVQSIVVGKSGHYVYIVNEHSTIEMRPVIIGQKYDDLFSIESGITIQDRVVYEGQLNLYAEMPVSIERLYVPSSSHQVEEEAIESSYP